MAIHFQEEKEMQGGFKKIIEDSAQEMMLDLVQKYQYQYPIKSTVRELASNSLDSISDREIARKILLESIPASSFYIEREGVEFNDSKFDPNYYDFNWLGDDNIVSIDYIIGKGMDRDKVIISDNGVGLGGIRLEKYFNLGYSTKRLSKIPLGKFGIGGKAALSLGEPFYTMESRYNGKKFLFNIYSHKFDSLTPQFNLDFGIENPHVVFYEGTDREMKVYYTETMEKNGMKVIISAKKNHKQQYIDAVKSQLLYFQNINFNITDEFGYTFPVSYKANIIYEDDKIILSDNTYWSKPHLIINGVNYGYINFEELELEDKRGNIGIKIASSDVDINPSRESIIWNETTKKTVLERFNEVVEIAQNLLQTELQTTDYLEWLRNCYEVIGKNTDPNSVIGRLARIVDLSNVKPVFGPEPKLKFQQLKVFDGLFVRHVSVQETTMSDKIVRSVDRNIVKTMGNYIHLPVLLMNNKEHSSYRKDKYLFTLYPKGFITVMEPLVSREAMLASGLSEENTESMLAYLNREGENGKVSLGVTWEYLLKSSDIQWYDEVKIPDDFQASDSSSDDIDLKTIKEKERQEKLAQNKALRKLNQGATKLIGDSNVKRRKAEGKILIYTPRSETLTGNESSILEGPLKGQKKIYTWQKMEVPIVDMNTWEAEEIYYAIGSEMDPYVHFAAMLSRDPYENNKLGNPLRKASIIEDSPSSIKYEYTQWQKTSKRWFSRNSSRIKDYKVGIEEAMNCQHFFDTEIMLIKVSQANLEYMEDFLPLTSFFKQIRNNIITMSSILVRWNTARLVKEKLHKAHFLFNFDFFNSYYANLYKELYTYVDINFRDVHSFLSKTYVGLSESMYGELIKLLDQVQKFQEFVASDPTPEEIEQVAKESFGMTGLKDGYAVDPEIMDKLDKILEYTTAVGPLLNYIPILTGGSKPIDVYEQGMHRYKDKDNIPITFEEELRFFLEAKGALDFGKDEVDFINFQKNIEKSQIPVSEAKEELPEEVYISPEMAISLVSNNTDEITLSNYQSPVEPLKPIPTESNLEIPEDKAIYQTF